MTKKEICLYFPLILFFLLGIFLSFGLFKDLRQIPSELIDKPAPHFLLPSLFDERKKISSNRLKGKVTFIHVWASWCRTCQQEKNVLWQVRQIQNLKMIAWNYKDQPLEAKQFLERQGNPYDEVLWDEKGVDAIKWGIYAVPQTFVVDKHGVVRYGYQGSLNKYGIEKEIQLIIKRLQNE